MARDITYTESEANAVRRKVDLRILPIIILSYICSSPCILFWMFGAELRLVSDQRTSLVSWRQHLAHQSLETYPWGLADRTNMYVLMI